MAEFTLLCSFIYGHVAQINNIGWVVRATNPYKCPDQRGLNLNPFLLCAYSRIYLGIMAFILYMSCGLLLP